MSMATAAAVIDYVGLLTDTCTIRRFTDTGVKDDLGRPVVTWADLATLVDCRLDTGGGREITIGKEVVIADFMLFLKPAEDITEKDRVRTVVRGGVTILAEDSTDEDGCEVRLVETPGGLNHHKEVALTLTRT